MALTLRKIADKNGPEPPRNLPDPEGRFPRPDLLMTGGRVGDLLEPWPLAGVELVGDPPAVHRFKPQWLLAAVTQGWASLAQGRITLHTVGGDVAWRIVREPGAYCCCCGDRVGDGPTADPAEAARRCTYVAACQAYQPGADPENPAGYRVDNYYEGHLEA